MDHESSPPKVLILRQRHGPLRRLRSFGSRLSHEMEQLRDTWQETYHCDRENRAMRGRGVSLAAALLFSFAAGLVFIAAQGPPVPNGDGKLNGHLDLKTPRES